MEPGLWSVPRAHPAACSDVDDTDRKSTGRQLTQDFKDGISPPTDDSLVIATQSLFTLHQSRFQRLLAVTWGGSTAVRACLFRAVGVSAECARAVLDDWVLWRRIAPLARIVTVPVINSGAESRTGTWSESSVARVGGESGSGSASAHHS